MRERVLGIISTTARKLLQSGFVAITALCIATTSYAKSLSFTFDDGLNPAVTLEATEWNGRILAQLKAANVQAMLFPTLRSTGLSEGLDLVRQWSDAGHDVGNHTASHHSLSAPDMNAEQFINDVQQAEKQFRKMPTFKPMLRFPYLKEGETKEKRDAIREWMRSNGYRPAEVSIDGSDWYYSTVYLKLRDQGDVRKLALLKKAYIDHLLDRAGYYDALARRVLHRSPAHVLLLHTNAINAAYLADVMDAFKQHDWNIIPPREAFEDSIYLMQPDVLPAGESIVWSLAKGAGIKPLRYPAEDLVYEEPKLKSLGLL
ncbi:MAG TPA: polysaccharide deacetylase family protein [Steroidobacteraceae bacterium]|nr:polysaccharide deacetylase family protein [Steroidobacteraceae bacterium]